ncbi:MAG: flagellin FliC [Deltaproteobacteria bacterium]|nr:flagellin FliC [Deltaproteobacteria bacterium]
MGLRISTNIAAMAANRALSQSNDEQAKHYIRLSSGNRITAAGDDAAGLSISENLRAQIRSMAQAERNANDGISFVQVAEGGLTEIGNILIRMRELAVQASSDTVGEKERGFIHQEVGTLLAEIDRIANVTNYNGTALLNGESQKSELQFQVGIRKELNDADRIVFQPNDYNVKTNSLGVDALNYESIDSAREAMDLVDGGIGKVFEARARLGATQNKLHATVNNLGIAKETLANARSRIADTDIASETTELVRGQILQSAGVAVLAQANTSPMMALKLL